MSHRSVRTSRVLSLLVRLKARREDPLLRRLAGGGVVTEPWEVGAGGDNCIAFPPRRKRLTRTTAAQGLVEQKRWDRLRV